MFISSEEYERRKSPENNLILRMEVPDSETPPDIKAPVDLKRFANNGTQTNQPRYTTDEKILIGTTAQLLGAKVASEVLEVPQSYAQAVKNENYAAQDSEAVRKGIYAALESIRESAREKLLMALGLIDENTLSQIPDSQKAKTAAQIAHQLSGVVDRTIEKTSLHLDNSKTTHLHLYSPEIRAMDKFQVKRVNSNGNDQSSVQSNAESHSE